MQIEVAFASQKVQNIARQVKTVTTAAAVLAMLAQALSGCGHGPSTAGESTDPRIATHPEGGGGDTSYVLGTLELQDGCLSLVETHQETAGRRWVPALPAGTARIAESELDYRGQRYRLGSEVQIGGSPAHDRDHDGYAVPEACDEDVPLWTGWGKTLDVTGTGGIPPPPQRTRVICRDHGRHPSRDVCARAAAP